MSGAVRTESRAKRIQRRRERAYNRWLMLRAHVEGHKAWRWLSAWDMLHHIAQMSAVPQLEMPQK